MTFVIHVVEILSSNQRASQLAAHLLSRTRGLFVPPNWTDEGGEEDGGGMKVCCSAGPPHGDSAGLQVYKDAAMLSPSPRRRWPGCSASPASWSAARSCCRAKLQVSTPGPLSVCLSVCLSGWLAGWLCFLVISNLLVLIFFHIFLTVPSKFSHYRLS